MTAMMSAMTAIVRVFMGPPIRSMSPGQVVLLPGALVPFPAAAAYQSFGSYASSTPRATLTILSSG